MHNTIQSDLMRRHIDTIILKSLYGGDRYGADIVKEVEAKSSGQFLIKTPTIYSSFRRLEAQGIIRSYWGDTKRGGQRKYYSITNEGHEYFAKQQTDWEYFRTIGDSLISDRDFDLSSMPPLELAKRKRKKRTPLPKAEIVTYAVNNEDIDDPSRYKFNFVEDNQTEQSQEQLNLFGETQEASDGVTVIESNSDDGNGGGNTIVFNSTVNNYNFGDGNSEEQSEATEEAAGVSNQIVEEEEVYPITVDEELKEAIDNKQASSPVFIVINNHAPANEDKTQTTILEDYQAMRQAPDSYSESLQNVAYTENKIDIAEEEPSSNYFVDFEEDDESDELPEPAFFSGSGEAYADHEPEPTRPTLQAHEAYGSYNKTPVYATQMEPDYKNVLTKLARPAMQDRPEEPEPAYDPEPQLAYATGHTAYKDLQSGYRETTIAESSRSVVEVSGDHFKVRTFDTILPDEYSSANYYYSNKLLLVQNIILFSLMLVQIVAAFGVFMSIYNPQYPEPDWIYYIGAVLIAAAIPIFAFILAATDYNRTKRYNTTFKSNLLFKTIVAIQLAIAIYVINIIMGMPARVVGSGQNITGTDIGARRIVSFFLPIVLILNLPLSAVVFHLLYKSRRWAVDRYSDYN